MHGTQLRVKRKSFSYMTVYHLVNAAYLNHVCYVCLMNM